MTHCLTLPAGPAACQTSSLQSLGGSLSRQQVGTYRYVCPNLLMQCFLLMVPALMQPVPCGHCRLPYRIQSTCSPFWKQQLQQQLAGI
jgi:hypothetical protein